jgi:sarcosine oxidase subunit gamma
MQEGETHIHEENPISIVSLGVPRNGLAPLDQQLQQLYGVGFPRPGKVNRQGDSIALLGLQTDQCFLVSATPWPDPVLELNPLLADYAYLSDQSDSWASVIIEGPLCRSALERMSTLDVSAEYFTTSSVARTAMDHLSVIIEQPAMHRFRLFTPRSSAQDFAHALCTSLTNVSAIDETEL